MRTEGQLPGGFRDEAGQASIELVACLPALLLAGLLCLQLLVAGYTMTVADGAAEAGALALAADRSPEDAARAALPGWAQDQVRIEVKAGRISVSVRPPSALKVVGEHLEMTSVATAKAAR